MIYYIWYLKTVLIKIPKRNGLCLQASRPPAVQYIIGGINFWWERLVNSAPAACLFASFCFRPLIFAFMVIGGGILIKYGLVAMANESVQQNGVFEKEPWSTESIAGMYCTYIIFVIACAARFYFWHTNSVIEVVKKMFLLHRKTCDLKA